MKTIRAYFELLRFPAVFTAIADVMMGFLVTRGDLHPRGTFVLLTTISALLYLSGMALNDVFDADVDARNRPHRPIPSQRISRNSAAVFGWSLLGLALLLAAHVGIHTDQWRTTVVSFTLAGCVVLYDLGSKRTFAGPLVMGSCRLLNVLLGMSLAAVPETGILRPWNSTEWAIAAGAGCYVTGITIFARTETRDSTRRQLSIGIAVMLAGVALVLRAASYGAMNGSGIFGLKPTSWPLAWCVLTLMLALPIALAMIRPRPDVVQFAVRRALQMIIVLDMATASPYGPNEFVLAFLALLVLTILLERRISTT